jgi:hypothetical protein
MGAGRALAAARKLEEIGRQEDLASVPETLAQLEAELALVESALVEQGYPSPTPTQSVRKNPSMARSFGFAQDRLSSPRTGCRR